MTTKPPVSKRQASTSAAPVVKPDCKVHSLAAIHDRAQLTGTNLVEIGQDTILHPWARIKAEHSNVSIGKGCIIAEEAIIGPQTAEDANDIVIGDGVSIETSAMVAGKSVGQYTTIGVKAKVGKGAVVGSWCKIAPLCEVPDNEVLPDFTVVYGQGQKKHDTSLAAHEDMRLARMKARAKETELLKTLIPDAGAKWRSPTD